jgi:hypothetical protein
MKTKLNQKIALTIFASIALLATNSAHAQGDKTGGGGNSTEADLQSYINKLDAFLNTDEGKQAFPEIVAYDQGNPNESFHQLVIKTHPVVRKGELKDSLGTVRGCVSYIGQYYFVCNSELLPENRLDNQPSFYRIVFHELLVQAGIERPINQDVPSEYPISSRINDNIHLETYQQWVPGKKITKTPFLNCTGYVKKEKNKFSGLNMVIFQDGTLFTAEIDSTKRFTPTRVKVTRQENFSPHFGQNASVSVSWINALIDYKNKSTQLNLDRSSQLAVLGGRFGDPNTSVLRCSFDNNQTTEQLNELKSYLSKISEPSATVYDDSEISQDYDTYRRIFKQDLPPLLRSFNPQQM